MSSWGGGGGLLGRLVVSSMIILSVRLLCLRGGLLTGLGGLGLRVRSLVCDTSMTSDLVWLDTSRRGEDRDRRRITTSSLSSTTDDTGAAPPIEKQV